MILSSQALAPGSILECDICIVGSGAAGLAMALRLLDSGIDVLVLEAGGERYDAAVQACYDGEAVDPALHSPPATYRQRRFGGSTAIWGGCCVPFDPIDFEARDWVPDSGWPIGHADLLPYYADANELLEAGRFDYDARTAFVGAAPPMVDGFRSDLLTTDGLERFSCPTDLAQRYRGRLAAAGSIRVLLDAACVGIDIDPDGRGVRQVRVASMGGNRLIVRARDYVLAAGGIETPRLLLASNDVRPAGIGNATDQVGRYYMCHFAGNIGEVIVDGPPSRVSHGYQVAPEGVYFRRRLALTEEQQRRLQVSNMVMRLHLPRMPDPSHRNGVLSSLFLARRLISYEYARRLHDGTRLTPRLIAAHLRNVVVDSRDTAAFAMHWLCERWLADRKFPSVILRNRSNRFSLEVHAEQTPFAGSRIELLDGARDALGMPKVRIDWRYRRSDIDAIGRTLDAVAGALAAGGGGRFRYDRARLEDDILRFGAYGGHHIGTTRMSETPRTGVVDAHCRVHDVGNLFVAGSSVFPTSGQATPTLTLVALALRLADHLAAQLAERSRANVVAPSAAAAPAVAQAVR